MGVGLEGFDMSTRGVILEIVKKLVDFREII